MQIGHGLHLQQTQKLMMTPELRQAITILQYPAIELIEYIQQQTIENPVLEIEEKEWERYQYLYQNSRGNISTKTTFTGDEERNIWDTIAAPSENLEEYLLQQARMIRLEPSQLRIINFIIGNLDDMGYFSMPFHEAEQYLQVGQDEIEKCLKRLQTFDPLGVGSRNLQEFLQVQLQLLEPFDPKAMEVVTSYLSDLGEHRFSKIAQQMNITVEEVEQIADLIKTLRPRPSFGFDTTRETRYILPDILLEEVDGEFIIIVNDHLVPRLRVSPYYTKVIRQSKENNEAVKFVSEKWNQATWLMKSIERRRETLYNVAREIVEAQRDFFFNLQLKPLTLKEIAEKTGIHESTVSRAISGKYIQTPKGTFELKFFFAHGLASKDGDVTTVNEIKRTIEELVGNEDKKKPYSDQKLTDLLNQKGIEISRRTVTKYREELNILSSSKRKRYN